MQKQEYTVGKRKKEWHDGRAQVITFIVTDDCNLRCKYCYITHKNADTKMDIETAKQFIDKLLSSDQMQYAESVILEFIGGEPMMEATLIDEIADYFKIQTFMKDHKWYWNYRLNVCTNGVNYDSPKVQKFIKKNVNKLSLSITLDGVKEKHDMQRVFENGSGSFDKINENVDLWLSQFPGSTKVTFASDDLPLLCDSIIYLWNRGIKNVSSNVVFEDVWKEDDDKILEGQLIKLADYVIENQLYDKGYYCSFFDETIGFASTERDMDVTFCGAGKMIALSPKGNIYPCMRYYGYSLNNHEEWAVGNIEEGIDMEKVRPFVLSTNRLQSDDECLNCDVASGCGFCQGYNYDESKTGTNFYRAKHICKMHKARVRANDYFFSKLYNKYDIKRASTGERKKSLYFLLDDIYTTYCCYENITSTKAAEMSKSIIEEGLKYARFNAMQPIFVHSKESQIYTLNEFIEYDIINLVPIDRIQEAQEKKLKKVIPIYTLNDINYTNTFTPNVILNVHQKEIQSLGESVVELYEKCNRINLNFLGLDKYFNATEYTAQLSIIADFIKDTWTNRNKQLEFNLLTDTLFLDKHDNCGAGVNSFVLVPSGDIYTCCGCFSSATDTKIGDLSKGIVRDYDQRLYRIDHSNLCRSCNTYQCKNCVNINKNSTREINVSPSFQCIKSHIEKAVSEELETTLRWKIPTVEKDIKIANSLDPIEKFMSNEDVLEGYYKTCD